jgi:endoglycosylceramidase
MHRRARVRTLCVLLGALLLVGAAFGRDAPRLGQAGRWFTDPDGRVVVLRGVNMVSKLPPYTVAAAGFGEEDAALIAAAGFNVVRLGVIHSAVEPSPGRYDDAYLDDLARTVDMLARHGIWSLLDFHQDVYGPAFGGAGLAEWATFTDGLPEPDPNPGFPTYYYVSEPLHRAFDSFWQNREGPGGVGIQDRYAAALAHVAARFAHAPGVLGYELMNEPFPGSAWRACYLQEDGCPEQDATWLAPFNDRVGGAIRAADPTTLVFYEPWVMFDLGRPTHVPRPALDGVAFAFHPYGCEGVIASCDATVPEILALAETYAAGVQVPLIATEWGAFTPALVAPPRTIADAITAAAAHMDDAMMSWIYWTWANKTPYEVTFGSDIQGLVADLTQGRTSDNVRWDRLDALARPFPRAVAGTPLAWGYDAAARVFELTFSTAPAGDGAPLAGDAHTEVVVPLRHYPDGYAVSVTGADVVSDRGEAILRLVNHAGSVTVRVRVAPPEK